MASQLASHRVLAPRTAGGPRLVVPLRSSRVACRAIANVISPRRDGDALPTSRRELLSSSLLLGGLTCMGLLSPALPSHAGDASGITVVSDEAGFGTVGAQRGTIVLVHYVGYIDGTDTVFDSTRGGLTYRDGGIGVLRPTIIRITPDPVPGICAGLKQGLEGMRVGGRRTFTVPPELGFKDRSVLAPYAVVPPNSTLRYEVELLRLSNRGPDELTKGISRCGQGGMSETAENCATIEPAEFV